MCEHIQTVGEKMESSNMDSASGDQRSTFLGTPGKSFWIKRMGLLERTSSGYERLPHQWHPTRSQVRSFFTDRANACGVHCNPVWLPCVARCSSIYLHPRFFWPTDGLNIVWKKAENKINFWNIHMIFSYKLLKLETVLMKIYYCKKMQK